MSELLLPGTARVVTSLIFRYTVLGCGSNHDTAGTIAILPSSWPTMWLPGWLLPDTHCGEFVSRDFFSAPGNGVEEQILQTGQDACLPSPVGEEHTGTQDVREQHL